MDAEKLGQVAYEAFVEAMAGSCSDEESPYQKWEDLPAGCRAANVAAALAILELCRSSYHYLVGLDQPEDRRIAEKFPNLLMRRANLDRYVRDLKTHPDTGRVMVPAEGDALVGEETSVKSVERGGLWRGTPEAPEGKYLVLRRDGTVPPWFWFVLGSADPAAPFALRAYADEAERLGFHARYVEDVRRLADTYEGWLDSKPEGDPDAKPHRQDAAWVVDLMRQGRSA